MISFGIFGSLFGGAFADFVGRSKALMFTLPVFMAAWIIIGAAPTLALIQVGRCLSGLADGASFTVMPVYLSEIGHPGIRG